MLKQLRVQGLRGYKGDELYIEFNQDLNLLTGRNGAGKTTALKLVWYLLSGNFEIALDETPFKVATLLTDQYSMTVDFSESHPSIVLDLNNEEYVFRRRTQEEKDAADFFDFEEENTLEQAADFVEDLGSSLTGRMAGEEIDLNVKVAKLLKAGQSELTDEARALIEQFPPDAQLLDRIRGDYPRLLRGKTWLGTLSRHICAQGRMVQHAPIAVLTYGMRSGGPLSKSLIDQIQTLLGKA